MLVFHSNVSKYYQIVGIMKLLLTFTVSVFWLLIILVNLTEKPPEEESFMMRRFRECK